MKEYIECTFSGEIYKAVDRRDGITRLHVAKYQQAQSEKEKTRYVLGWFELPSSIAKRVYSWDHATVKTEDRPLHIPEALKSFRAAKAILKGLGIVKSSPMHIAIHPQGQNQKPYIVVDVHYKTATFINLDWLIPPSEIHQEGIKVSSGGELFRPHLKHNARATLANVAAEIRRVSSLKKGPRP
jgi:hypothetical protein